MKIAVWHNLPSGGGKRALYHHVKGLVERGHHVESWCPPTADRSYLPLSDLVREHVVPLRAVFDGRGYFDRVLRAFDPVSAGLRAMNEHCRSCAEQVKAGDFDVLFANSCYLFATTAIGRFTSLPGVLYLQEPCRYLYEALQKSTWAAQDRIEWRQPLLKQVLARAKDPFLVPARRLQVREEIKNAKAYRRILVNSSFSRESVLRAYGVESRVCYLGVDTNKFLWSDAPRKGQIVGVGYLQYQKGVDRVIRALAAIPREIRPLLLWIGNGSDPAYRRAVEQLAAAHEVAFEFREKVTDAELIETLQVSYAAIYLTRLEPFGYGPLEANCCGLPVIGVAEGGIRETIQDGVNGFLALDSSPDQIAASLMKLLHDPQLAENMRRHGRRMVEQKWSIEGASSRLEHQLLSTLDEALQRSPDAA